MFDADKDITREEAAMLLYGALHAADKLPFTDADVNYTDRDEISGSALEAVITLTAGGAFEGYGDGTFRPTERLTRAEAVKLVSAMDE